MRLTLPLWTSLIFLGCSASVLPPRGEDGGADAGLPDAAFLDAGVEDGGPDGGILCTFGEDLSCSSEDWEPVVGRCLADGTCTCEAYEYFLDPLTGRCRWGECSMLGQDCPDPGDACYPPGDRIPYPHCSPAGTTADDLRCQVSSDCRAGSACEIGMQVCARMCDPQASDCPDGKQCQLRWARRGMPGLCF